MYCTRKFLFMWQKIRSSAPGSGEACVWTCPWNPPQTMWLHQQEDREETQYSSRTRIGCQTSGGDRQPPSRRWARFIPKSVAVTTHVNAHFTFTIYNRHVLSYRVYLPIEIKNKTLIWPAYSYRYKRSSKF